MPPAVDGAHRGAMPFTAIITAAGVIVGFFGAAALLLGLIVVGVEDRLDRHTTLPPRSRAGATPRHLDATHVGTRPAATIVAR